MEDVPEVTDEIAAPSVSIEMLDHAIAEELGAVIAFVRQCGIDASRFGSPPEIERAFNALCDDLQKGRHYQ